MEAMSSIEAIYEYLIANRANKYDGNGIDDTRNPTTLVGPVIIETSNDGHAMFQRYWIEYDPSWLAHYAGEGHSPNLDCVRRASMDCCLPFQISCSLWDTKNKEFFYTEDDTSVASFTSLEKAARWLRKHGSPLHMGYTPIHLSDIWDLTGEHITAEGGE